MSFFRMPLASERVPLQVRNGSCGAEFLMNLEEAIELIKKRWPDSIPPTPDEPVFVLAAGWRGGSTLLQRMLLKHCLVWGEPYGSSALLERLAQTLRRFGPRWPTEEM